MTGGMGLSPTMSTCGVVDHDGDDEVVSGVHLHVNTRGLYVM